MVIHWQLNFSKYQEVDRDDAKQTSIFQSKVNRFLVCATFYNLDLPSVIWYTGGKYTSTYQDVNANTTRLTYDNCDTTLVA